MKKLIVCMNAGVANAFSYELDINDENWAEFLKELMEAGAVPHRIISYDTPDKWGLGDSTAGRPEDHGTYFDWSTYNIPIAPNRNGLVHITSACPPDELHLYLVESKIPDPFKMLSSGTGGK